MQRDQFTNEQIPVNDRQVISKQHQNRLDNHMFSEFSKAHGQQRAPATSITIGHLVYLRKDGSKHQARDRYLVTSFDGGEWCSIRKFVGDTLRNNSYRARKSDLFKVRESTFAVEPTNIDSSDTDDVPVNLQMLRPSQQVECNVQNHTDSLPVDILTAPYKLHELPVELTPQPMSDVAIASPAPVDEPVPPIPCSPHEGNSNSQRPRRQCCVPTHLNDYVTNF